ncbi:Isocitrate lyase [Granulibacter bethesdensis]|uniref:Isocitrate lyase n=3 Tax=Granulibacter bethesdensis TaxID=364410 RepID=Q0BUW8_GRABC|nr:Isocitrate lyase [Granulibacter bethesdensis CGDNIH1]AHJ62258.1 Isocitrate lyase [Granulibacter bethesdensis]AHJ64886.1 Isocitrate lyase [Granulibacter bethesdensis CGDNIH4]AHJ67506.1 Isocitrate lyase [Granulibacter bethesdensis]APH51176.1 Isocitrate lyase [Granulibacter bethesdensis]
MPNVAQLRAEGVIIMRHMASICFAPDGAGSVPFDMEERFAGVKRDYTQADVEKLAGSFRVKHTIAEMGAKRLWTLLRNEPFVNTLGALTGNQAVQQVKAGLKAIYLSGWQVAADANLAGEMYPDQSLYPANSVPAVVRRINNALRRSDQIAHMEGAKAGRDGDIHWMAPIVADAEAGFGGALNSYELMKAMIDAGAAGVHFEDQLASEKKCGHLGGKVLVPISQHIRTLNAARLAADVEGVPTVLLCRTDSHAAQLLTTNVDERDHPFISGERTPEGFYRIKEGVGVDYAIARSLAYAPYADLLWWETSEPNLEEAEQFANAIAKQFPGKMLAYNCSPSFNWKKKLPPEKIAEFQRAIGSMGYKFQFVTLAGFHSLNYSMFQLARGYKDRGMAAYSELQQAEFSAEADGYTATRHQREVGVSYFDAISMAVSQGQSSTTAFAGSTEEEQFH